MNNYVSFGIIIYILSFGFITEKPIDPPKEVSQEIIAPDEINELPKPIIHIKADKKKNIFKDPTAREKVKALSKKIRAEDIDFQLIIDSNK